MLKFKPWMEVDILGPREWSLGIFLSHGLNGLGWKVQVIYIGVIFLRVKIVYYLANQ